MGVYDMLTDGDRTVQVKCWDCRMVTYHIGDKVPTWADHDTYTIVLPGFIGSGFALVVNGVFKGLTNHVKNTFEPYVTKWGEQTDLTVDQDEQNPVLKAMKALVLSSEEVE